MNRKLIGQCAVALAVVAVIGLLLYTLLGDPSVDVSQITKVTVYGKNRETGKMTDAVLEAKDADKVFAIFNGKKKTADSPGDLFRESGAFILTDGDTDFYYYLAGNGGCFVCSAGDDTYFEISEAERTDLVRILSEYCGYDG